MKFLKSQTDLYLENTALENLFIYEYMIPAKGDYVKVYLLAKMYAERDSILSNQMLAKELNLPLGEVLNAWDYWESKKIIIKHSRSKDKVDYDIEFLSLKRLMFGDHQHPCAERNTLNKLNDSFASPELTALFTQVEQAAGRTLNPKELQDIKLWHEEWGLEEQVILKASTISAKNKKKGDHAYLTGIIKNWYEQGLFDLDSLEKYLAENDKRHNSYKRIFRALGFRGRFPSEEEMRIMDVWFDEYFFDIAVILDACKKTAGISSPSISYIHAILKSWYQEGNGIVEHSSGKKKTALPQMMKEYEQTRATNQALQNERIKQLYLEVPRIREIDAEIKDLNPRLMKKLLAGQGGTSTYKTMEQELENLRKEKSHLLKKKGYDPDYLEPIYTCPACKDTAFLDSGEKCLCLLEKMQ